MFNRRKANILASDRADQLEETEFLPFKPGTRQLKKGYRYAAHGRIVETSTGRELLYQKKLD